MKRIGTKLNFEIPINIIHLGNRTRQFPKIFTAKVVSLPLILCMTLREMSCVKKNLHFIPASTYVTLLACRFVQDRNIRHKQNKHSL